MRDFLASLKVASLCGLKGVNPHILGEEVAMVHKMLC
ncbi:MAG: hypothetical protein JWO08_3474 [Verrucomicrobiaceae bacterium]|nr:hypothetical protein [Verrucomicrobiaceae bacterium]